MKQIMRKWRIYLSVAIFIFVCGILSMDGNASGEIIAMGEVDEEYGKITWIIDAEGKLTVNGTGDVGNVNNHTIYRIPWCGYAEEIRSVDLNVKEMTSAECLFWGCKKLKSIDFLDFDASQLLTTEEMFGSCESLEILDLNGLDTRNVIDMSSMFSYCKSLYEINFNVLDTGNVREMNRLFSDCKSLKRINLEGLDTSSLENMRGMFGGCVALEEIDLSVLDLSNVTYMRELFSDCYSLRKIDLSGISTSNLVDMSRVFMRCSSLEEVDVSSFDTSNVNRMDGLFSGCVSLKSIDVTTFNTINVEDFDGMFEDCRLLKNINLKNIDTKSAVSLVGMFWGCTSLETIDVSAFDTSKVDSISEIFKNCSSLETIDISNFDTSNVNRMDGLFSGCVSLNAINVTNFDTSKVESMKEMFKDCSSLKEIDVSNFDTSNLYNADAMFENCNSLKTLNLSNFDLQNARAYDLIKGCYILEQIETPKNVDKVYLPIINEDKWYCSDGTVITEFPKNLPYSIIIAKNRIPEEVGSVLDKVKEFVKATPIPSDKSGLFVMDANGGAPIYNASVKIGSETFKTDEEGKVLTNLSGKQTVSVAIGDNIKVRSTQKTLEHGKFIIITVATDNSTLWVASADIEIDSETFDLMDSVFYLTHKTWDEKKATEKGLKKAKFVLQVQANGEPKKYQLIQNNEIVQENYDGCFEFGGYIDSSKKDTVYYTDGLKSGYAVYVKVYDIDGKIAKQCLGLKIAEASSLEIKNNILNGSVKQEFSLGNKLKVTVPNEIPLIGGGTLDLGIMKDCPIKMSMDEDGMVKVAVNMGEFDTGDTGAWYQVKEDYEKLSKRALKLSNSAAAFGGTPQSFGGGMFKVKASVAGYGEGYLSEIKDGRLKVNVGLIVEASAEKTFTKYAFIYFVPVYINFGGGVELESKGLTYLQYENSKFSVEGGNLEIEPEIYAKLKGGVGAEDLLDVYASGKLGFSYLYRFAKNYQRLSMTGDAEVGLNVWIYNKPMLEINDTWVLYDSNRKNVTSAIATNSVNTTYGNLSGAEIISTDYLQKRNGLVRMVKARGVVSESELVLDYAFQNASPMLLKAENALYLFYLDGVAGREAQNQTALFYQKSTDGGVSWSSAVRVDDNANETADYNYDAVVSGNDVYVVWSDAGSVYGEEFLNLDSEDGIHRITKEMNLMLAHIDGNSGDITTRVIKTEQADLQPHIMADEDGDVHIAWLSNDVSSEDGMFSVNNEFKLLYASSAKDYEITEMVLPAGNYPLSLDLGMLDENISIAVNVDVDQELGTQEDREIYLWNPAQNQGLVQFTVNEVIDSVPKFASVAGEESIFWYQNGNVVYTSDGEAIHNIFTEEHPADIGQEFEVLESADGKASIVWTVTSLENEKGIEMYCSDFDGAAWSAAYKLSDLNSEFTSKLSGYLSGDDYRIAYLGRKVEDSSIHAGIYLIKPEERVDSVIGYSMEGNGQAGEVYPITLNVENKGNTVITEMIVESDDGEINDSIKNLNIAPGTVEEIVYEGIVLPSEMWEVYNCNLTVKALEESESENNMVPVSVGHPDFEVSASMDYSAGYYLASLMLKNNGIMTSDAVLKVYSDETLLKQVYETEILDMAAGESRAMVLNADALDKTTESLYFVVSDKNETEIHLEDNKSFIYVGKGNSKEDKVADNTVVRIYGQSRYETGYKVADALKEVLGVNKFEAVVVATGKNFADALAGSYLAVEKNAPILLTNGKADNIAQLHSYIRENVTSNGTIYILGGEGAVPMSVDAIEGYIVKRLFGNSRYDTNIEILREAGVTSDSIIVATGKTFADSLSASAAKLPILLVKPGSKLNDVQKSFLEGMKNIYIIGGEGAVSIVYEAELAEYAEVTRVYGASRYDTSVEVARTFVENAEEVVVASGKNFPDGLCGGPLAATINAPLILTADGKTDAATDYMVANAITSGYVLGGAGALADESVVDVFALGSAGEITDYTENDEDIEHNEDVPEIKEENTYSVYWCTRNVTVHGSSDSPVYFYRSPEATSVTDPVWDKYLFEAKIVVLGYIESDSVGRRYIADIPCGGGDSAGEMIRYYIPSNLITENSISHTYGAADKEHPHRKYCDCGDSVTTSSESCRICYPESSM